MLCVWKTAKPAERDDLLADIALEERELPLTMATSASAQCYSFDVSFEERLRALQRAVDEGVEPIGEDGETIPLKQLLGAGLRLADLLPRPVRARAF